MITEHTLRVLEYDRVRSLVADRTASVGGRERARTLAPVADRGELDRRRTLVEESIALLRSDAGFPDVSHDDLSDVLHQSKAAGALLPPDALLRAARVLRVVRVAHADLTREETSPALKDRGEALAPSPDLEHRITHAIGDDGSILDGASPQLGRLRRQAVSTRETLRRRLESMLGSLDIRTEGDSYVTFRNGRYVVPVAAGDRGKVKGIVHDQSGTGQTLFVEPFGAVEENNALARCDRAIDEEERKILLDLSARVADFRDALDNDVAILGELDYYRAVARLAVELDMVLPEIDDEAGLKLVRARHPLLVAEAASRDDVIPLDLGLESGTRILILTGPNMGGKTVALKTLGLVSLMAMCALPVVAESGTTVPFYRTIAADIGDEQSIQENLSTFASHLRYLVQFIQTKEDPALILLDELGTGTDPAEGGALARAYLEVLDGPNVTTVATTHLGQLKDFAAAHPAAVNGSMAFDEETLSPRFSLELGTPGRSRAFEVAERLSFPKPILDRARTLLGSDERRMDELLAEVERSRAKLRQQEGELEHQRAQITDLLRSAEEREKRAGELVKDARTRAASEADEMLREAASLVKETRRKLTDRASPKVVEEMGREVHARQDAVKRDRPEPVSHRADLPEIPEEEILPGVELWSVDLGVVVIADDKPSARRVRVKHGGIRFTMALDRLRRPPSKGPEPKRPKKSGGVKTELASVAAVGPECDLRGLNAEEAQQKVEQYLDAALLGGLGVVRIIHGIGTGVLKQRVGEVLSNHIGVARQRPGESGEGGLGVTIAYLSES